MNKNNLVSILFLAGTVGLCESTYATNNGHLDGVWLNARIKTTIPKALNFTNSSLINNAPVDTGKDKCYVLLKWGGLNTFSYDMEAFCLNGNGAWERGEFNGTLYELDDVKQSLGYDWTFIYFAQQNRTFAGFPANYAYTGYEGTLILTPKLDANGNVKSIKTIANSGTLYSWDNSTETGGTSRSGGLKLKFVKTADVPAGAIACAAGSAPPLCP